MKEREGVQTLRARELWDEAIVKHFSSLIGLLFIMFPTNLEFVHTLGRLHVSIKFEYSKN